MKLLTASICWLLSTDDKLAGHAIAGNPLRDTFSYSVLFKGTTISVIATDMQFRVAKPITMARKPITLVTMRWGIGTRLNAKEKFLLSQNLEKHGKFIETMTTLKIGQNWFYSLYFYLNIHLHFTPYIFAGHGIKSQLSTVLESDCFFLPKLNLFILSSSKCYHLT